MALDEVWAYFKSYDKDVYEAYACGQDKPSEAVVVEFERGVREVWGIGARGWWRWLGFGGGKCGWALDSEFRTFTMSSLGGVYLAVRKEHWSRPEAYDVGPFWTFLYGLFVPGLGAGIPEWMDLRRLTEEMRESGSPDLIPCLKVMGDADPYCFRRDGRIVRWLHEEPDEPEEVEGSFSEVLMREIRALEDRLAERRRLGLR